MCWQIQPIAQTDGERAAGPLPPLVAMVKEEVKCGETAFVSKGKGDWIIIQQVALIRCPHHQVTNGVGLPAHTGRAIISHQPSSSAQHVKDITLLIDLSGQWPSGKTLIGLHTYYNVDIIYYSALFLKAYHVNYCKGLLYDNLWACFDLLWPEKGTQCGNKPPLFNIDLHFI